MSALLVTCIGRCMLRDGLIGSLALGLRELTSTEGLPRIRQRAVSVSRGRRARYRGISALITARRAGQPLQPLRRNNRSQSPDYHAVLCAFCGIHPIIMISSFAPMIMTLESQTPTCWPQPSCSPGISAPAPILCREPTWCFRAAMTYPVGNLPSGTGLMQS